jgi:hypothetical protein
MGRRGRSRMVVRFTTTNAIGYLWIIKLMMISNESASFIK